MKADRSRFDYLNAFIKKRHRVIVVAWILALALSAPLTLDFFSSISFNVVNGGPSLSVPNSESEKAQAVLSAQFPSTNTSTGPIIVVFQNQNVYSDEVKDDVLSLNQTLGSDPKLINFTGILSPYSEEGSLLDSTIPIYITQIAQIAGQLPSLCKYDGDMGCRHESLRQYNFKFVRIFPAVHDKRFLALQSSLPTKCQQHPDSGSNICRKSSLDRWTC